MNLNGESLLILSGHNVDEVLRNRDKEILNAVRRAYQAHDRGNTFMPPNAYLRFPNMEKERIIAKPAYLGEEFGVAGMKWIASFPGNLAKNMERASATLVLNSMETGCPIAVLESSIISAKRTAASAALAAQCLWPEDTAETVGLVGCGLINFETLRFLLAVYPDLQNVVLYDLSSERMDTFRQKALQLNPQLKVWPAQGLEELLREASVISLATTAVTPHIESLAVCQDHAVVLHISLRDLMPEVILSVDNVVDDIEQVCSNKTSLDLAEQQVGHRNFIRSTIGKILNGNAPKPDEAKPISVFSPFGLGILDMAVAKLVYTLGQEQQLGTVIPDFLPKSWLER